jgi:hypothetical protein
MASPYIAMMIWAMFVSSGMCLRFFTKGVNEECEKMALEWTKRTITERDGLSAYEPELLSIYAFLAWLSVFMGWIILAHLTVFLWRWLLNFLLI